MPMIFDSKIRINASSDGAFLSHFSPLSILSSYLPVKTCFASTFNPPKNSGLLHPLSQQFECKVDILIFDGNNWNVMAFLGLVHLF